MVATTARNVNPTPCHPPLYHNTLHIETNHLSGMGLFLGIVVLSTQRFQSRWKHVGTSPHKTPGPHVLATFFNNNQHGSGRVRNTWARPRTKPMGRRFSRHSLTVRPCSVGGPVYRLAARHRLHACPLASLQPRFPVVHLDPISCPSPTAPPRPTHH